MRAQQVEEVWVWRQRDGMWRWSWVCREATGPDGEDGEVSDRLVSNKAYESVSEAHDAAQSAFPELVVGGPSEEPEPPPARRRKRRFARAVVGALVLVRRRQLRPGRP
jgi:ferric-dicitrate binding protein FerR (iron transport regulator)